MVRRINSLFPLPQPPAKCRIQMVFASRVVVGSIVRRADPFHRYYTLSRIRFCRLAAVFRALAAVGAALASFLADEAAAKCGQAVTWISLLCAL